MVKKLRKNLYYSIKKDLTGTEKSSFFIERQPDKKQKRDKTDTKYSGNT